YFKTPESSFDKNTDIASSLGIIKSDLFLLNITSDAPAARAGIQKGDYILKIDNEPVSSWVDVTSKIKSYTAEQGPIRFDVKRGEDTLTLSATPEKIELPTAQGAIEARYA